MQKNLKRAAILLLTLCMTCAMAFTAAAAPDELTLFDAGTPLTVVLPANADDSMTAAAQTLLDYLTEITGTAPGKAAALPENANGGVIALTLNKTEANVKKGSYTLRAQDGVFYIEAAEARGLFNGVYGFLRRVCGVEIYAADVKKVPQAEKIAVELPYLYEYSPTLEYADTDWISPHDLEFALANGLNGTYSPIEDVYGGKVNYLWFCHSITNGIVPEDEFFETHPEYYALREDGKRHPTQLCLSNPEVVKQSIQDVMDRIKEAYDPNAALNIISVTQDDNYDYCLCENCTALADQYGGQSGLMLWYVNQIADEVAKEYPDVVVDTFAYQYTRQAPTGIAPRDNVCVRLCSIECCFSHPLNDPACERNVEFMKDLRDWSKLSSRLYIWDYVTNFGQTLGIFPNFGVLRENVNTFRENNVVGIYEEGAYYASECYTEFFDLRAYLLSCFMRDDAPTAEDEAALRKGFLETYYGGEAAGNAIGEILDIITAKAGDEGGHTAIGQSMQYTLYSLTTEDAARVDALWDTALAAAKDAGEKDAVARIERSRLGWRYYEACLNLGPFKGLLPGFINVKENKKLIEDMEAAGITRYNEGRLMKDLKVSPFVKPSEWGDNEFPIVAAGACGALITACFVIAAAVIALRRKQKLTGACMLVLLPVLAVLCTVASKLFVEWNNLPLYAFFDALMLLSVAGYVLLMFRAKNGCRLPKGKKLAGSILLSLLIAALPYELIVLLINTIIFHGLKPVLSITLSAFCLMAVLIVCALLTIRGVKKAAPEKTE